MPVPGHSRQAWYQGCARGSKRQKQNAHTIDFFVNIRCRQPGIGTHKLHYLLNAQADKTLNIGQNRLFSLLDELRLLVPVKRAPECAG